MKARQLRSLLERELGYVATPGRGGSHRKLRSPGRRTILFAFHDGDTVGPALVRDILVKQAGLCLEEAKEVVARG
jgi:predicted RNA binding protein YcfA (HicA-like mRNA interferase family)